MKVHLVFLFSCCVWATAQANFDDHVVNTTSGTLVYVETGDTDQLESFVVKYDHWKIPLLVVVLKKFTVNRVVIFDLVQAKVDIWAKEMVFDPEIELGWTNGNVSLYYGSSRDKPPIGTESRKLNPKESRQLLCEHDIMNRHTAKVETDWARQHPGGKCLTQQMLTGFEPFVVTAVNGGIKQGVFEIIAYVKSHNWMLGIVTGICTFVFATWAIMVVTLCLKLVRRNDHKNGSYVPILEDDDDIDDDELMLVLDPEGDDVKANNRPQWKRPV